MIAIVLACVAVLVAGGVILAALILEISPSRDLAMPAWFFRLVEHEGEFSAALGWSTRNWWSVRGVLFAGSIVLAWTAHVAFVELLAVVIGVVGPRLLLGGRAERRRIQQARAFVTLLRQFASQLAASNEPFDAILAEVARNAPDELSFLREAAGQRDVLAATVAAIQASRSDLLEKGMVTLLVSRTRDRITLSELLVEHQIPEIGAFIDEAEEIRAVRSSQNATITVLAGALLFTFAFLNGVPTLHDFYGSAAGSVALLVVACVFVAAILVMKFLIRQPRAFRWDLQRVVHDVGRISGA